MKFVEADGILNFERADGHLPLNQFQHRSGDPERWGGLRSRFLWCFQRRMEQSAGFSESSDAGESGQAGCTLWRRLILFCCLEMCNGSWAVCIANDLQRLACKGSVSRGGANEQRWKVWVRPSEKSLHHNPYIMSSVGAGLIYDWISAQLVSLLPGCSNDPFSSCATALHFTLNRGQTHRVSDLGLNFPDFEPSEPVVFINLVAKVFCCSDEND